MPSWTLRRIITRATTAVVVTAGLVVTACAPVLRESRDDPYRPRLIEFLVDASGVASGCHVLATVRFEDPDADIDQAVIGWQYERGSRTVDRGIIPLPVDRARFRDKRSGEVEASLMFFQNGTYWLTAQLIDARGGRSNTRQRLVNVLAQTDPPMCEDTRRRGN